MRLQSKVVSVTKPAELAVATVGISMKHSKKDHSKTMTAWTVLRVWNSSQCGTMEPAIAWNHQSATIQNRWTHRTHALARTTAHSVKMSLTSVPRTAKCAKIGTMPNLSRLMTPTIPATVLMRIWRPFHKLNTTTTWKCGRSITEKRMRTTKRQRAQSRPDLQLRLWLLCFSFDDINTFY